MPMDRITRCPGARATPDAGFTIACATSDAVRGMPRTIRDPVNEIPHVADTIPHAPFIIPKHIVHRI